MATNVEGRISLRDVSAPVRARRRSRLLHAVVAVPAIIAALAFVDVLPPGTSEIAVASASVGTLPADGPMPSPVPMPPLLPPGLPVPAPVVQDFATAMQALQNLAGNGDDVAPSDDVDDFDTSQAQDQQQQEELQQQQDQQIQNQLNTNAVIQNQDNLDSQQLTQEQNDEAQQQVDDGEQQAEQTEIDAGQ
jgi:hypothetical protein